MSKPTLLELGDAFSRHWLGRIHNRALNMVWVLAALLIVISMFYTILLFVGGLLLYGLLLMAAYRFNHHYAINGISVLIIMVGTVLLVFGTSPLFNGF